MNKIVPNKLNIGDEIRVIAPSRSMKILSEEVIEIAKSRLEQMGFKVTFGKNVMNSINDDFGCASILDRVEDLHDAFKDKNVKAILTVIGGYNINQLLDYIDYNFFFCFNNFFPLFKIHTSSFFCSSNHNSFYTISF